MKKQTAVEKMAEWLEAEIGHYVPHEKLLYIQLIISNAKALEKEQIMEAFLDGYRSHPYMAKQYYKETYGGEE
jgi:hypothetical protein